MYTRPEDKTTSIFDFNESLGIELDTNQQIIKIADSIPWNKFEKRYASLFPSHTGRPAFSFRCAICTLILQTYTGLSDRKLIEALIQNPYYQYFIGLKKYTNKAPFKHTTIVNFRKRITLNIVCKVTDEIVAYLRENIDKNYNKQTGQMYIKNITDDGNFEIDFESKNLGTAIIDATCSPQNIKYPQDYQLLNNARKKTEDMIDKLYKQAGKIGIKPKTYRRRLDKEYLKLAKSKKKNKKELRALIKKLLNALVRNMGHIERFIDCGGYLSNRDTDILSTIKELYKQQRYMFINHTHRVKNRIVSIDQPYIRPIVRGKVKSPVEFGCKYDVSIATDGFARLEKISFDPYNESEVLIDTIEKYRQTFNHYPSRVLVDKIYRTKKNIKYCADRNITISGPRLGRPPKDIQKTNKEKQKQYKNNVDRIEIERFFSKTKRCYGANLIKTKLQETTFTTIALTVLTSNLFSFDIEKNIFLYYFFDSDKTLEIDQICLID